MIHTGVTSTAWRRAARRIRSFTTAGRSRKTPGWRVSVAAFVRTEHRLEIDDRRSVDRLQRSDADPLLLDREHAHPVEPDRVRTVRRASGEDAGERPRGIAPGMDLEDGPVRLVEPGQDQDRK